MDIDKNKINDAALALLYPRYMIIIEHGNKLIGR